jgi:hypothetical protein
MFCTRVRNVCGRRFAVQKADVWGRWQAGQSLHKMGRAFSKEHSSVGWLVSRNGGFVPAVRWRSLRVLTVVTRRYAR